MNLADGLSTVPPEIVNPMTRMPPALLGALTAALLVVTACDDKAADGSAAAKPQAAKDAPAAEAKADAVAPEAAKDAPEAAKEAAPGDGAEAAAADGAAAPSDAKIGVDVCDEYVAKYAKCIAEHAPEARKKPYEEALAKTVERWQGQAKGPEKDSLQQACTAALDAVKKTSKNWGCTYD